MHALLSDISDIHLDPFCEVWLYLVTHFGDGGYLSTFHWYVYFIVFMATFLINFVRPIEAATAIAVLFLSSAATCWYAHGHHVGFYRHASPKLFHVARIRQCVYHVYHNSRFVC